MPSTDWIAVSTQLNSVPPEPPDTPRIYAMVAPAVPAGVVQKVNKYSSLAQVEEQGWTTSYVAYNAMVQLFTQTPTAAAISELVVIKRETPVANVWTIDILSDGDGDHTILIDGVVAATFTASTDTQEAIKDGLIAAFNNGDFGDVITAASVDSDTLSLTADEAGIPFTPTATAPSGPEPTLTETVANVGVFDDLEEAYMLAPFWGVLIPGASEAEAEESLRWVQMDTDERRCVLFAETADADAYNPNDSDNLAARWAAAKHPRAALLSHPTATDYRQSANVGRVGGAFPGSRTWHYFATEGSTETTITAARKLTDTATLRDRFCSYTERLYGPKSDLLTLGGYVSSGHFIFQRHAEDWWWYTIRETIDRVMKGNLGVNLNDAGLQGVVDTISQAMIPLVDNGVIGDDFVVAYEPTDLTQVPASQRARGDFKTTGRIIARATITPKLAALAAAAQFDLA